MVKLPRWIWMPILIAAMATLVSAMPNLDMAIDSQQKLVESRPDDASAHNDLANLFVLAGQNESAEQAYQRALQLAPNNPATLFNLGLLRQQVDQLEEAEQLYRQVLEVDPRSAWSYYQLGTVYATRGQEEKAIDHFARAFGLNTRLSLASHNPHVIDNEFVTRALIRAERYVPPADAETPLVFGEGDRLRRLLMPEKGDGGAVDTVEPSTVDGEDGAQGGAAMGGSASGSPVDPEALTDEDIEVDETTGNRVLTTDSLDRGSQLGKASGGSTAARGGSTRFRPGNSRTPNRRPSTGPRFVPGRSNTPVQPEVRNEADEKDETQQGGSTPTVQRPLRTRPSVQFRPGVSSTGRLELELLAPKAETEERWAKLTDRSI